MRVDSQRFSGEVANFATHLNLNPEDQNSAEKIELLKKFVEFLDSSKHGCKHKHKMHKHGHEHHGMFKHFGKHGHGKHGHGKHGKHGKHHGHYNLFGHHGHHGPHHGHDGSHGHRGFKHGHHGHHFRHHGLHGLHGHHGKYKAHWTIDLTQEEQENDVNTQLAISNDIATSNNQANASTNENQGQTGVTNCSQCQCTGFERRHCRRAGRWMLYPFRRNVSVTQDNAAQTETPADNANMEQENLSEMVENITIENTK